MKTLIFSRKWLLLLGAMLCLLAVTPATAEESQTHSTTHPTATIATGALNVRSGPGVVYGVTAVTYQGHVVQLLGRNHNATWAKIQLFSGHQGWVNAAYLLPSVAISSLPVVDAPAPPAPNPIATIATGALNVRSGPGVAYSVVTVSRQGHVVQLLGRNHNATWARVRVFTGQEGWINASLIHPNVSISSLPVADAPAPNPIATIATGALNVRSGPGVAYGVVTVSRQGHVVQLLGRNHNATWARVRVFTGQEGWVNASLIHPNVPISGLPIVGAPAPTPVAVVATGALNVRYGPSVGHGAFAVIYQGQQVTLLGRNHNSSWVKIQLGNGAQGWVNASLVQANVPLYTLPVAG